MPKRNSSDEDFATNARRVVEEAIGGSLTSEAKPVSSTVSRVMSQMGRRGGKKGGKRRLETMTPEQRSQVALRAAQARWSKKKER